MIGRRLFLGSLGLMGLGAVGYGGSLAACTARGTDTAMLRPLLVALGSMQAPERIGDAWLRQEKLPEIAKALTAEPDLMRAVLIPDDAKRQVALADVIRAEFARGDIVVADRWVVSRTEARLAAVWLMA
ncbi:MAG: hypothetical protein AAFU34_13990 [Pseudomonadota bacterium]